MALEGATLYYKKMHSIDDQVCMNTYESGGTLTIITVCFMRQLSTSVYTLGAAEESKYVLKNTKKC